jgi:hypothetical protein
VPQVVNYELDNEVGTDNEDKEQCPNPGDEIDAQKEAGQ